MIKVGVVGGTGYTGIELLRVLVAHPQVALQTITSRSEAGRRVDDLFPSLRGYCDLVFVEPSPQVLAACDIVFFATPHGIAQDLVSKLWRSECRIIDLSADFRLRDAQLWERWYGQAHQCPELLQHAVYGLPEKYRAAIADARLVACAGCYPTAVQLGFWPLLANGLVESDGLIANVASGVSGAGRQAKIPLLFAEMGESYKAYSVPGHRHQPEIVQGLSDAAGHAAELTFVPHLIPMTRGIHATLYARLRGDGEYDLQALYEKHYAEEACVDVLPPGSHPETRSVRGANICRLAVHRPGGGRVVVVLSVIDNLAKGAATQAVQNMNIMCSLPEKTGLDLVPMVP